MPLQGRTFQAVKGVDGKVTYVAKEVVRGNFSVYQGIDASGNVRYVGIPGREPAARFAEHAVSGTVRSALDYRVVDGATGLSRIDARIWEQTLINKYGLGTNNGQLFNQINSISPRYWWQYSITP